VTRRAYKFRCVVMCWTPLIWMSVSGCTRAVVLIMTATSMLQKAYEPKGSLYTP
jgi:hypothetical protein